jgi:Lar family restriction alleviation protein
VSALLPCPLCGGEASIGHIGERPRDAYIVDCPCGASIDGKTEAEAIAAWNRRTPPAGAGEAVYTGECTRPAIEAVAERVQRFDPEAAGLIRLLLDAGIAAESDKRSASAPAIACGSGDASPIPTCRARAGRTSCGRG